MSQHVERAKHLLEHILAGSCSQPDAPASGMESARAALRRVFDDAIAAAYPGAAAEVAVAACAQPKHGDYQCNNAMGLHGALKKAGRADAPKAPRAVAEAIVAQVPPDCPVIESLSLAGPGFINVRVSRTWLEARVRAVLQEGPAAALPRLAARRVVIDFSSPNVAKEMHVGHLRSTIIGDTLAKLLELCGADVLRLNHVGDWGTQFGMLIQYMREEAAGGLAGASAEGGAIGDLMALYRRSKVWFDASEAHQERAREAVTRLQAGDKESLGAWRRICAASRFAFDEIYCRLGVELTERGESYYNPALEGVIEELSGKGLLVDDGGSKLFWPPGADRESDAPLIARKRDGGYGYASTDLACIRQRALEEKADWIIYVTDAGQAGHFELIFAAARAAGWIPAAADAAAGAAPRVSHVPFGLVLGEDGKRMKTREGKLIRLAELLDEARDRCKASLEERLAAERDATDGASEAAEPIVGDLDIDAKAAVLGYGAVKYADLKNSRLTSYKFSFDDMLALKGNTAIYLQYAHARIAGIIRKSGADVGALAAASASAAQSVDAASAAPMLEHDAEVALALAIARFPEAVEDALAELMPNRVTEYLYALSEALNSFYGACRVLGSGEREAPRLALLEATASTMRACFGLLGITPLYRI